MAPPLLSAALIVRDEEQHLADCLTSIAAVCDEIVVVDTGSVDATVDIAEAHGAKVLHRPWDGDFSAARNHGLDAVQGEWVLYIDADERLQPVSRADLEVLLAPADHVAYTLGLRPSVDATPYREYRLWRNRPDIRFAGVIHEKVHPSIVAASQRTGMHIGDVPLELIHVGYDGDQTRKHLRNQPLLEAQLAVEPDNIFNWRHLARTRRGLGDEEGALAALREAIAVGLRWPDINEHAAGAYCDLAELLRARGEDASAVMAEGRERHPGDWMLVWLQASFALQDGHPSEALVLLDELLAVETAALDGIHAYDERIFGALAHEARGLALFRLGRFAEAADSYGEALAAGGAPAELTAKQALARARAG